MDVGCWLRSLGLDQYEAAFRENAIEETVLPSLTAEDLKDLGVSIVGHRRKLLDAIAALRADANANAALAPATTPVLSSEPKCTTPADLIIGTVDQDLRECCHAMLFAFVG